MISLPATPEDWGRVRAIAVAVVLGAVFTVIVGRSAQIALAGSVDRTLSAGAVEQVRRSDILDRNGDLLATTLPSWSLSADPRAVWDPEEAAMRLSEVLPDVNVADLQAKLSDQSRHFVWVRRGLTPRQKEAVFNLGLEGVWFEEEARRVYPGGRLAGHVLGFTDVDGKGVEGVEHAFEARLAEGGEPLRLTIDAGVQFALEDEIEQATALFDMKGGAGVVLDARTGALRAVASWPFVDPNLPGASEADARLNRALGAVYELGSIYKPLTIAAAIDAGVLQPSDTFDVSTPLAVGSVRVKDLHPLPSATAVTPADILAYSSNIGTALIGQRLGSERLHDFLAKAWLLERPVFDGPSIAAPLPPKDWSEITAATVSYGHGIAVSPLAFASSFTIFGHGGAYLSPVLLEDAVPEEPSTTQVVSPDTAAMVLSMMREVVTRGSGSLAEAPGYEVAGKTGTAEKAGPGGYDPDHNITSFAAVFPASRPEFVVLIVLDDAQPRTGSQRTASHTSAAIVGRLIARIAPMLDVKPVLGAQEVAAPAGGPAETDARTL